MREQQRARPRALDAPRDGAVQGEQHRAKPHLRGQPLDSLLKFHRAAASRPGLYCLGSGFTAHAVALADMHAQVFTIARFTLLEAIRTRLPLLVIAVIGLIWAGSLFVHQVAITESTRLQASVFAAGARLASVFVLALYITSSMVREFNEKGLELVLALALPRCTYLFGKLAGFLIIAGVLAFVSALPLLLHVSAQTAAIWSLSLAFELGIVAAASMFCVVTFSQVLPAVTLVAAFYLLCRSVTAMRLMAESSLLGTLQPARPALNFAVDALAYAVPALDRFSLTQWVAAGGVAPDVLPPLAGQCAIYVALLLGAALFDFYRREL
jgi:ABC-type transport system involved in multi-copper enzyme maturation permease subunit